MADDIFTSYKVTGNGHFRLLNPSLSILLFGLVGAMILVVRMERCQYIVLCVILFMLFIWIGPAFYLHYRYYLQSRYQELRLREDSLEIFENGILTFIIFKKDVETIHLFMSPALVEDEIPTRIPSAAYNYMEINTANFTVQINNLLFPDLKYLARYYFDKSPIYHKRIFANID